MGALDDIQLGGLMMCWSFCYSPLFLLLPCFISTGLRSTLVDWSSCPSLPIPALLSLFSSPVLLAQLSNISSPFALLSSSSILYFFSSPISQYTVESSSCIPVSWLPPDISPHGLLFLWLAVCPCNLPCYFIQSSMWSLSFPLRAFESTGHPDRLVTVCK